MMMSTGQLLLALDLFSYRGKEGTIRATINSFKGVQIPRATTASLHSKTRNPGWKKFLGTETGFRLEPASSAGFAFQQQQCVQTSLSLCPGILKQGSMGI